MTSSTLSQDDVPSFRDVSPASIMLDDEHHDDPDSSLGSLFDIDQSIVRYLTDVKKLESLVSMVESCSSFTASDVESWVHPLMLATSKLESVDGAAMTERLLAKCLDLVAKHEHCSMEDYMKLPYPNAEMYNMTISALAKSGSKNAAKRATRLLELMSQEHHRNLTWIREQDVDEKDYIVRSPRPDIINYTTVMNSYCKSGTEHGIKKAQAMLEELEQLSGVSQKLTHDNENRIETPLLYLTPDQACYNAVITGWARSPYKDAPAHIERILQRMDALYECTGDSRFQPDTLSFHMLITAYAKSVQQKGGNNKASVQAAICAENVLCAMYERYSDSTNGDNYKTLVKPDVMVYNSVLNAWAHTGTADGARRAESILLGLLGKSSRKLHDFPIAEDVLPNTVTFNIVINAWAKSGDGDAGYRSEKLLDVMSSCDVRPDTITFNALMNAWSLSKAPDAGERIESILRYMLEQGGDAKPNVISFSTAILGCGKSQDDNGAVRAELLLEEMERLYNESKDQALKPNELYYDGVIFSWLRRSGNGNQYNGSYAAERAEAVLKIMKNKGQPAPGLKQYNRVLNAWLKHGSKGAKEGPNPVDRARLLLTEMASNTTEDRGSKRSVAPSTKPDVFAYNCVIATCALATETADGRREAFFTAVDTFNRLCKSKDCDPNNDSYRMMFDVCVNLLPRFSDSQIDLMEKLFKECCKDGLLSNDIVGITQKHLSPSLMQEILGPGVNVYGKKEIFIRDLPDEWSRFFGKTRRSR
jgi:hypothetical protein